MSVFLETKRLTIRRPEFADFDNLYALQSDADVMQYIGTGVRSREQVRNGLQKAINHQEKCGFSLGSVYEKETGTFIGRAGLIYLAYDDTQSDIEVGYALKKEAWGRGYATELTKALINWGFSHLQQKKTLIAVINPQNDRSRHVLEKVGMNYVGLRYCYETYVALYEIAKPTIDVNEIKLHPASIEDYPLIQNLGRFYVYDMSEYLGSEEGWQLPSNGLYECIDFRHYWEEPSAFPFLIYYEKEIAGFAIIDKKGSTPDVDFNMAQFFIVRKFKRKGIGKHVAQQCFEKFRGTWEVMVIPRNEAAYRFWRSTIKKYTNKNFIEDTKTIAHFNHSKKNIFRFKSDTIYNAVG